MIKKEYRENKMILTHPSGVVSEYTKEYLEYRKVGIRAKIPEAQAELAAVDADIAKIEQIVK